ncbi:MAG: amylo-alpha-1,6-glucosidase [Actinomycetota bacterium]|nr:amylo-alpha-1,6-glucosidase [Actinomycetota bacterium]
MRRIPHPIDVLYGSGTVLACALDGEVRADDLHGLFAGDTRVLSTYRLSIGGQRWQLLSRERRGQGTAAWVFQNPAIRDPHEQLLEGCLCLRIERRVAGTLRDDITITSYATGPTRTTLTLQLDADFADIFEVKSGTVPPRLGVQRTPRPDGTTLVYEHSGFRRALQATLTGPERLPEFVGSLIVFDLLLDRGEEQTLCVECRPEVDGHPMPFPADPHNGAGPGNEDTPSLALRAPSRLQDPFARGCADLRGLAMPQEDAPPYVAAGAPWFYTLFGRDSLLPGLMASLVGTWPSRGALAALGRLQARERDDWRDAEPGKLPHEVRKGELAHLGAIPHTPYYGTHETPSLYCLALWNAWRWTGDRALVEAHLETARAALRWCDELGDRDGDGLQEYATRSRSGYYNQSWKDAGDAIVNEDGSLAALPLATVELQGYLYAARLALAELVEERGEHQEAGRLRAAAADLRALVEARYWLPDRGFYALALDGGKQPVEGVTSNPGHLLWCGLPSPERAEAVARRFLEPDLFTGWGLRTLSSEHRRYNPLSYQRGSVWPHDTVIAAAGAWRYGRREEAATLIRGVLEAACEFENDRLPELFCGFDRSSCPPVPYREANVPQAWAAAAPVLATQLFLGFVPDAPNKRCFLRPYLPEWLPSLEASGIRVGGGTVDVTVLREAEKTVIREISSDGVDVRVEDSSTPLWGKPMARTVTQTTSALAR